MNAFSETRAVSDAHFGRRFRARRFGRDIDLALLRAIFIVARDFDACVWARGDRGRSHGIQLEKLATIALAASLDAPRALRTGLRDLEEAWDA